jgi:hypothetical protein
VKRGGGCRRLQAVEYIRRLLSHVAHTSVICVNDKLQRCGAYGELFGVSRLQGLVVDLCAPSQ